MVEVSELAAIRSQMRAEMEDQLSEVRKEIREERAEEKAALMDKIRALEDAHQVVAEQARKNSEQLELEKMEREREKKRQLGLISELQVESRL